MYYKYLVNIQYNKLSKNIKFLKSKERSDIFVRNYWLSTSDMGNCILSKQYDSLSNCNQDSKIYF